MRNKHTPNTEKSARLSIRELTSLSLIGAGMVAGQVALAAIPNVEVVSLLIIICAITYGWKTLYPLSIFVLLEVLLYGLNLWVINYLYVWLPLVLVAIILRKQTSRLLWATVSGTFGLFFGALCSILYLFIGGPAAMFTYWVSGIPFDLIHCVSNAAIAFVLVKPLSTVLTKLSSAENSIKTQP